jgi:hypothetical protein
MTPLLVARLLLLAGLVIVVACYVWAQIRDMD